MVNIRRTSQLLPLFLGARLQLQNRQPVRFLAGQGRCRGSTDAQLSRIRRYVVGPVEDWRNFSLRQLQPIP